MPAPSLKSLLSRLLLPVLSLAVLSLAPAAYAQTAARQDHAVLRQLVETFLTAQAGGMAGDVKVSVGAIDPRLSLPACVAPEAFLPNGSRAWGKTSAGIRCSAPSPWTVYVSAQVQVQGDYFVAAVPLAQGQVLQASDLAKTRGDLAALPPGVITDPAQALGYSALRSLALGTPLRQDLLKGQQVIAQGQVVRVVGNGRGFTVTTEGRALNNGSEGQLVQARTGNGQLVSGIARAGGMVEVNF